MDAEVPSPKQFPVLELTTLRKDSLVLDNKQPISVSETSGSLQEAKEHVDPQDTPSSYKMFKNWKNLTTIKPPPIFQQPLSALCKSPSIAHLRLSTQPNSDFMPPSPNAILKPRQTPQYPAKPFMKSDAAKHTIYSCKKGSLSQSNLYSSQNADSPAVAAQLRIACPQVG